jgi:crotonobetainyl-CoA:carnitine CoA-transferase CaiB-like acyl-CoA transferase
VDTPFAGLRVLDLSRIFAGPYATQFLADLGADVVKVEQPGVGDSMRTYAPYLPDRDGNPTREGTFYLAANRNKRSATVDLSNSGGQDLIRRLAAQADVVVENFKAGDLARYGLDYEHLSAVNPGLIYCSITGFGQTGPYRQRPALDGTIQAISGLMTQNGEPDGPPVRSGVVVVDIVTALYAVSAITAALYRRDTRGGSGEYIDLSMLDVGVATLSHRALYYLITGELQSRSGSGAAPGVGIPAHVFTTADGAVFISANQDSQYRNFCLGVIDRPDLAERFPTFAQRLTHRPELEAILIDIIRSQPTAHWVRRCEQSNVVCSPVNDVRQALADPQVVHRDMVVRTAHPANDELALLRNPVRFANTALERYDAPPVLGQHTNDVLASWLGLADGEIADLRQSGAV